MAASPKYIVFALYDPATGAPVAGVLAQLTFDAYKQDDGTPLTPPSFVEIGGGLYAFAPTPAAGHGIAYIVNAGTSTPVTPQRFGGYVRYEDWYTDNADSPTSGVLTIVQDLQTVNNGKWVIPTTGPDANKLVLYAIDGVTILRKFALYDASGNPTTVNPYQRVPTT